MNLKSILKSKSKISFLTLIFYLFTLIPAIPVKATGEEMTKVKIRFQKDDKDYEGWNLWLWSNTKEGQNVEFTHKDEDGVFAIIEGQKDEELGFIIKKGEWETKATGDVKYNLKDGDKEIIIKAGIIDKDAPNPKSIEQFDLYKDFEKINIKVNYNRKDGDYDKWNLWNWIVELREGSEDTVTHFVEENDFGKVSNIEFENITSQNKSLGLIVRTDSWKEKDGGDKIVDLAYLDSKGNLEVFYKEGSDITYYSRPNLEVEDEGGNEDIDEDLIINQPGGNNKWYIAGSFQGWNNQDSASAFTHLAEGYYKFSKELDSGVHEFKIVKNGTWDGFSDNGNNFVLNLEKKTKIDIYVNEVLSESRINVEGVSGLPYYSQSLGEDKWPRLVGNIQSIFGENEWSPESAKQMFLDYNFDGSVYKLQRSITPGTYEAKVTFGANWDENYGSTGLNGENLVLKLEKEANVVFTLDYTGTKKLTHNYKATEGDFDGLINKDEIYFDSRDITYKKPFGAIKEESEDVTLRIATAKDDIQVVRAEISDGKGISKTFDMRKATTIDEKDYYEVTINKNEFVGIGIWAYKFILIDGETKIEYGDDSLNGGVGTTATEGVLQYNLTVYDKDFKTPDWMKDAVVYQIFPDRFYDGSIENNRAKFIDGYRGYIDVDGKIKYYPLQYFDGGMENEIDPSMVWGSWSDYPENPRHGTPENKPYYPNSKTDNVWTNEFYGGDIQGIEKKLDYLKSIGVTVIYLNPVAWAGSNHKYDATDYNHLDPMFGKVIYNKDGDEASGINYTKTREASDRVYQAFAKAAKKVGVRIIADGVFNHVGDDSIYFDRYEKYPEIGAYEYWARVWDKVNDGKTQEVAEKEVIAHYEGLNNPLTGKKYSYPEDFSFINWFIVENQKTVTDGNEHYKYEGWWGYDSLPVIVATEPEAGDDFAIEGVHEWNNVNYRDIVLGYDLANMSDSEANKAMQKSAAQRWIWMGSSGWRLDVAPDVSTGTWQEFRDSIKSLEGRIDANGDVIDDPIILGEEWGVATHYLLGDQFDSVMNYQFRTALQNYLLKGSSEDYNNSLEAIRENYPKEAWQVMLNLVGSHDTVRNATKMDNPNWEEENNKIAPEASDNALKLQELTAILQFGYPGAPTIYYGDEVGVTGTKDPDSRRTFPWERINEKNGDYSANGRYSDLFNVYKNAAKVRNENLDIFATGDIYTAYAKDGVIAYARKSDTKAGLVVVNQTNSSKNVVLDVTGFIPSGLELKDELYGEYKAKVVDGKVEITIPAQSGYIMVSTNEIINIEKVQNLKAESEQGKVTLTWDKVEGADYYNVYRTYLDGQKSEKIGESITNSYIDNEVLDGTRYYYYVTTVKGTSESDFSASVTALPSFNIEYIRKPSDNGDMLIGVGKETNEILVEVKIPGLTDNVNYIGQDVKGFESRLVYYKEGTDIDNASSVRLRYKEDNENGSKTYSARFEPSEEGTYFYFAKGTTNLGDSYKSSEVNSFVAMMNINEEKLLTVPILEDIIVESNRATLNWASDYTNVKGFEVYRKEANGEYLKIAVLGEEAKNYTDFTVSNNKNYSYKIAAFNESYNRIYSEAKEVTPTLVMVDVTLRLHIPNYTPATDDIYIAGDFNGWNASGARLTVPSGATSRDVVEYTFKMMAGKAIQYKYTRGTWNTEAYTSHRRVANDTEDHGNWAYSSMDTNMKLNVQNQGGNKMVIDDYVIRWVDMPMIITMPRISYGENIEYTTNEDRFTLKANVPYGVHFTINGQEINEVYSNAMDEFGNVYVESIPLKEGLNNFELHIEPTQETIDLPWYLDDGRASQGTKTINLTINKVDGEVDPEEPSNPGDPGEENPEEPNNPGDPGEGNPEEPSNPGNPGEGGSEEPSVPEDSLIEADGKVIINKIEDKDGKTSIILNNPSDKLNVEIKNIKNIIGGKGSLIILNGNYTIELPYSIFNLSENVDSIIFEMNVYEDSSITKGLKAINKVYEFNLYQVINGDKIKIKDFNLGEAKISIKPNKEDIKNLDRNKLAVFYFDEANKKFKLEESKVVGEFIEFKTNHFSKFIIAEKDERNNSGNIQEVLPATGGMNTNYLFVISFIIISLGIGILLDDIKKKEVI